MIAMESLRDVALKAAAAAEPEIMRLFREGTSVELKADESPVTIADRGAERAIKSVIADRFPDHGFVGEEEGTSNRHAEYLWIVDPIDGTRNFIRGIPLFGTQIGLLHAGKVILGVSNMPAISELMLGYEATATLNGAVTRVSSVNKLSEATISFAGLNRREGQLKTENLLALIDATLRVRAFGDCYAFHLVASGRIEAVVQPYINIWDIAALTAIIEAAGGRCTDFDGNPIGLNSRCILASNGHLHDEILDRLNA